MIPTTKKVSEEKPVPVRILAWDINANPFKVMKWCTIIDL